MEIKIILEKNKPPVFIGEWTVGETIQIAQQLLMWINSLKLSNTEEQKDEEALT